MSNKLKINPLDVVYSLLGFTICRSEDNNPIRIPAPAHIWRVPPPSVDTLRCGRLNLNPDLILKDKGDTTSVYVFGSAQVNEISILNEIGVKVKCVRIDGGEAVLSFVRDNHALKPVITL